MEFNVDSQNVCNLSVIIAICKVVPQKSLKERINYNIAIQVYICINGSSSQGLENIFTHCNEIHSHSTRSANNLQLYCRPTHHKSFS